MVYKERWEEISRNYLSIFFFPETLSSSSLLTISAHPTYVLVGIRANSLKLSWIQISSDVHGTSSSFWVYVHNTSSSTYTGWYFCFSNKIRWWKLKSMERSATYNNCDRRIWGLCLWKHQATFANHGYFAAAYYPRVQIVAEDGQISYKFTLFHTHPELLGQVVNCNSAFEVGKLYETYMNQLQLQGLSPSKCRCSYWGRRIWRCNSI